MLFSLWPSEGHCNILSPNLLVTVAKYWWYRKKIIVAFLAAHERCVLNCMPKGENFFMQWASKVADGTRCSVDSYDICVDGKCEVMNACMRLFGAKSFCRSIPLFSSQVQWRVFCCSAAQSKYGRENRTVHLPYNFRARTHSRPALLSPVTVERIYDTFMRYLKTYPFLSQETCIVHREKHLKPLTLP